MAIQFKQKCARCKTNFVLATNRSRNVTCFDCLEKEMKGEITDPEMKTMFDIPEEMYQKSNFLCDIKIKYLRFGSLSERQIEAFNKTVKELKEKQ
jgi:DNA-directed RNA polymerase subunit RPC12/RpoP